MQCFLGATVADVSVGSDEYVIFYTNDVLGSPVVVSDEKGRVLWYENTQPFGKSLNKRNAGGNRFLDNDDVTANSQVGYTGHEVDSAANLIYMRARYYDPDVGRFYSNDPVGFTEESHTFGRYHYAANNPYKYVDPYGESIMTYLGGLLSESVEGIFGVGDGTYDDEYILSALWDGYDGSQGLAGFGTALSEDVGLILDVFTVGGASAVRQTTTQVAKQATSNVPNNASSSTNALKLEKQLASEEQLGQLTSGGGTIISQPAKQANRIAEATGRNAADIQKVSSDARIAKDGTRIETHSFRDASTNELIQPKTIIGR